VSEIANAYRGCRERITGLVADLDDSQASTPVPACPGWTVHDVVAHLAGGLADALAGRLAGAGTDAHTAIQVEDRRGVPLAGILEEWTTNALQVEPLMDRAGELGRQGVADVVSHEHDIRGALGRPGARSTDAIRVGLGFGATRLIEQASTDGVALRVQTTDGAAFGPGRAEVTLTGEPFELLRAITGRRSVDQLREMKWEGNVDKALSAFWWSTLHPAHGSIEE
jgi:uncharacterized protein (TIGR03083 family)